MERFTGILHQWSSSRIFLVYSRVYAINLLFATVVLEKSMKPSTFHLSRKNAAPCIVKIMGVLASIRSCCSKCFLSVLCTEFVRNDASLRKSGSTSPSGGLLLFR